MLGVARSSDASFDELFSPEFEAAYMGRVLSLERDLDRGWYSCKGLLRIDIKLAQFTSGRMTLTVVVVETGEVRRC